MPVKKQKAEKPAHGACPTCGHCRCCGSKPTFVPYFYPDWTYRPQPRWYGISGSSSGGSITATTGAASCFTLTSEVK